jgi:subtilisin family serine protease
VTQIDGASTNSNHSTHVAGTMIATGVQANAKGMAYQARLNAYDWNNDQSEMASAALNGLRVSNHSYGYYIGWSYNLFQDGRWVWWGDTTVSNVEDYFFGFYSWHAQAWDTIARNVPNYLIIQSAGNDRLEGPSSQPVQHWVVINGNWVLRTVTRNLDGGPSGYDCVSHGAVAKNVLTVGAVNDIPGGYTQPSDVVMSGFSAWGPTDDGRIKPDLVANGTSLYSSIAASSTSYGTYSGTSMAAPNVSGSLGLLLQYHKSLYGNNPMRGSTLKALVIHTGDEAGANTGPDYVFGWGLMNTLKAANLMQLNYQRGGSHVYERVLNQGQVVEIPTHATGSEPLRATICWTDPAATPPAPSLDPTTLMLANDLDLRIVSQGGTTYFLYILDPNNPSAAASTGDNVLVTVDQHLEGGSTSVDSIGHWEGGPTFASYAAPKQFSFGIGSQEVLRGAQKIISTQKYHRWNEVLGNVMNHRSFLIDTSTTALASNFIPTYPTITIKTDLIDAPGTTGGSM